MRTEMEVAEREDKLIDDLLDVIRFTEGVSAKLHRVLNEAEIYQVVKEEFTKSDHYTASILLLTDDGASLKLAETSIVPSKLEVLEKASGLRAEGYKIKLKRSSIYSQVVGEGKTVQANVDDIIREFLPRPLAYLISKTMGYDEKFSILTPLRKHGKVMGVLAMSCTDLCEYFLHSVENLALHISTALELAQEHAQRKRAVQTLKGYHDHLGELVEERTAELKTVNKKLREEITERKQAGEALRKSEKQASAAIEAARALTFNYNIATGKVEWGGVIEEITGYTAEEFAKVDVDGWAERIHPDDRDEILSILQEAMGKDRATAEYRFKTKKGYVTLSSISLTEKQDGKAVRLVGILQDITERKQAEEALRKIEREKSAILNSMSEIVVYQDTEHRILWTNKIAAESVGLSIGQLAGRHCYEVWPQSNKPCVGCPVAKAREAGKPQEAEMTTPDGRVWFVRGYPILDANNDLVGMVEVVLDITERKQVEDALQAEKNKLQSVVDAMEYGLTIQDRDYNIIYQNEPLLKIFGDHAGEKCYRAYEGKEKVCEGCPVEKAFKDGKSHTAERKVVIPSGEIAFWENTASPVRDARGKIVSCLEVTRNITERKQVEEVLRESEEKLQIMFESVTDGISVIDLKGAIIEANQRAVEMHGFASKDELLGRNALELVAPGDRGRIAQNMRKAIKEGTIRDVEYTLLRADGSEFAGELSSSILKDAAGNWVGHITVARDITERKQAEEALQVERNKLQSLINAMEDDLSIQDKDYNIIYQNEQSRISSGGDHAGEKCYRAYEGKEKVCEGCPVEKAFKDGKSHTAERKTVMPSGEVAFWENTANPIRDARGKIVSCLELARNITERKQVEKALRESEEKFSKAFRSIADAICITSLKDSKFIEVNEAFTRFTGYTREEVIGRSTVELGLWVKEEELERWNKKLQEQGRVYNEEFHSRMKSGEIRIGLASAEIINIGGEPCRIVAIADITERKQAEEALRESQEFSSSLLEGSPNPISVVNLDTSIKYVNPAFEKLTGFTLAEIAGRKAPYPWWPEGKRARILASFKDAVEHGGRRTERNFRKKNGERFWVELNSAPVVQNGKPMYLIISWLDITQRKQAEEKEKQLQQELYLAQRLASVGELAAGVAHEINNPLTGVLGFSQRLMRKSTDEAVSRDLEIIHGEARRAADVVQNLLTFARRRQPKKEYANINDIVQKTLELRDYALQTSNIEVVTTLAPDLPQIMVDFPQMQEVFLNIILNAEQAMNEAHGGGKLIIKTREIKDYVRISLADDGPGISPENLDKVFDPFFTTRGERGGTGLGLSACHGIVTEHGGRIYVRSKPEKGATFFIELPLSPVGSTSVS